MIDRELKTFLRGEPTERALLDLGPGLRTTAAMFARGQPDLEVRCELPPLPPLLINEGRINQTVANLMQNGVDAMHGRGRITVRAELGHTHVQVRVSDTGPSIPPTARARIFEPFFTTKDVGQGLGLGLAICREIIVPHGGTLEVDDTYTAGACFVISLPIPAAPGASLRRAA